MCRLALTSRRPSPVARPLATAFTLVELLVVIGIIALLISILMPALSKARVQANAISCSARIRQLTTAAMLYAHDNKQTLPPICTSHSSFPSGHWGRPTIFPAGGEGFLTKYLTRSVISASKVYVCPDFESQVSEFAYTSSFSYRYNGYLGGQDKIRLKKANNGAFTNVRNVGWKLSQIKNASDVALFAEGDMVRVGLSQGDMSLVTEPAVNPATGLYGHNPRYAFHMHGKKMVGTFRGWNNLINNTFIGRVNIGYSDGSVRGVQWKIDAYPPPVFPDTAINPYHPVATAQWSNNGDYN